MRRDFSLPPSDLEFLERFENWEAVNESNIMRVIIHGYPVPEGYNIQKVSLYLRIENTYPDTQIDMVYFHPPLSLNNNRRIVALSGDTFDGKNWQRWSRHRTASNPWRPGIDNIETHLLAVDEWLKRELQK